MMSRSNSGTSDESLQCSPASSLRKNLKKGSSRASPSRRRLRQLPKRRQNWKHGKFPRGRRARNRQSPPLTNPLAAVRQPPAVAIRIKWKILNSNPNLKVRERTRSPRINPPASNLSQRPPLILTTSTTVRSVGEPIVATGKESVGEPL